MSSTFTMLLYHIIFGTRERIPFITPEIRTPLYRYINGIVGHQNGFVLEIGGIPDHIHLLIRLRARTPVSELLHHVKGSSSRWLRVEKHVGSFSWQRGYGAFSVSESNVQKVRRYIQHQEEHHRSEPFQAEFARLLRRHHLDPADADSDE